MPLNKDFTFFIESPINGTREEIWQHITKMQNVNAELSPFVKMTYPANKAALNDAVVPLNETLFTSVILLFRLIPVDLHYLKFDNIEPGFAFYENSTTATHQYWKHTRSIIERGEKMIVRDEVHYKPRLPLIGYTFLPLYKTIFGNRHKKLVAAFK